MASDPNNHGKRRSTTIAALIHATDRALGAVLHLHGKGQTERAMKRLLKMEAVLAHALSLVQGVKRKLAEDLAPIHESEVDAFIKQLAELPEVAEPDHGK